MTWPPPPQIKQDLWPLLQHNWHQTWCERRCTNSVMRRRQLKRPGSLAASNSKPKLTWLVKSFAKPAQSFTRTTLHVGHSLKNHTRVLVRPRTLDTDVWKAARDTPTRKTTKWNKLWPRFFLALHLFGIACFIDQSAHGVKLPPVRRMKVKIVKWKFMFLNYVK